MKQFSNHLMKTLALFLTVSMPQFAQALGGSFIDSNIRPIGVTTGCLFNPYNDPGFQEAEISFFGPQPGRETVGGAYWFSNTIDNSFNAVTVSDLQNDCPFTDVTILSQNGADQASYAAEDLFELVWSATFNDDGQIYTYRIAMEGVNNTVVVNTRIINLGNVAPTANAGADQTVVSAASVTLDGSASDANDVGQTLTYNWTQTGGTGVTLSDNTAVNPGFTAPSLAIGDVDETLTFSLVVNDGIDPSLADTVVITVEAPINTAPTANAGDNQSVPSEAFVTLDGSNSSANDSGQTLTYAWSQTSGMAVTLSDETAVNPTFTAPTLTLNDSDELLMFSLVVNDGFDPSAPSPVFVTVEAPLNTVPTANAGNDQTVASESLVTLDGSNSDPNDPGQTLTYAWLQTDGPNVVLDDPQNVMPTFTAPTLVFGDANVDLIFQLNVDDAIDNSQADEVTITVQAPPNTIPTANAGEDFAVLSGFLATLDGSASSANDPGQSLTFSWLQLSGPTVTLMDADTAMPTFMPPTLAIGDPEVTLLFTMAVNDGFDTSTADAVEITVIAPEDNCAANPDNPVDNCSFEIGDTSDWTIADLTTPFIPVAVIDDNFSIGFNFFTTEATDGLKSLIHGFDGSGPEAIQIWQELTVVDEVQPVLTFDYRAAWDLNTFGATMDREFYVLIEPIGGGEPLQSDLILTAAVGELIEDTGPMTARVDLADFAGQEVRLVLFWDIPEFNSGPAQFQIDNFEIKNSDLIFADGFDEVLMP